MALHHPCTAIPPPKTPSGKAPTYLWWICDQMRTSLCPALARSFGAVTRTSQPRSNVPGVLDRSVDVDRSEPSPRHSTCSLLSCYLGFAQAWQAEPNRQTASSAGISRPSCSEAWTRWGSSNQWHSFFKIKIKNEWHSLLHMAETIVQ